MAEGFRASEAMPQPTTGGSYTDRDMGTKCPTCDGGIVLITADTAFSDTETVYSCPVDGTTLVRVQRQPDGQLLLDVVAPAGMWIRPR